MLTNNVRCANIYLMKLKNIKSWSFTICLAIAGTTTHSCNQTPVVTSQNEHKRHQRDTIKITYDTVEITTKNILDLHASGVFHPKTNTLKLTYFKSACDNEYIKKYCDRNNKSIPFVMRHEIEHARKAHLVKNTNHMSPYMRAAVATMNEIMAPAAEIIAAVDARTETGTMPEISKKILRDANNAVIKITGNYRPFYPVNFNNQQIADTIIEYATKQFLNDMHQGMYKNTIRREYERRTSKEYIAPNALSDIFSTITFCPESGQWDALWQFESRGGQANLWNAASNVQKQKLLATIDDVIWKVTGKFPPMTINNKTR